MTAYYNEIDPFAAAWLRELIAAGHIDPGDVDERSIVDVRPDDLVGYAQCHFFAGIGGWPHALRRAGWPDDRPVWTGSCPCQPFSHAGRGRGVSDERHLWPVWFRLIQERRPPVLLGEQVASKAALGWLDLVCADLEGAGYAVGAADLCAAGLSAPHLRQRLYWVAHTALVGRSDVHLSSGQPHPAQRGADLLLADAGGERRPGVGLRLLSGGSRKARAEAAGGGEAGELADAERGRGGARGTSKASRGSAIELDRHSAARGMADAALDRPEGDPIARGDAPGGGSPGGSRSGPAVRGLAGSTLGDASSTRGRRDGGGVPGEEAGGTGERVVAGDLADEPVAPGLPGGLMGDPGGEGLALGPEPDDGRPALRIEGPAAAEAGLVGGFWADADLIWCTDGRYRAVESLLEQMVDGVSTSMGSVCTQALEKLEKEVIDASSSEVDTRETLSLLYKALHQAISSRRSPGGLYSLYEAAVLLAFLRQLKNQGWGFAQGILCSGSQAPEIALRSLWHEETSSRSSHQRELEGQYPYKFTDALCILSSILARYAQEAWGKDIAAHAYASHPLTVGAQSRVGRLKGYGNAIVVPVATEFVRTYLEVTT